MAPKDLDELIEKYLTGKCTKAEEEFVDSLYSSLGEKSFHVSAHSVEEKISSAEARILENIKSRAHGASVETCIDERHKSFFWPYTGIAAAIVFCLLIGFYFLPRKERGIAAMEPRAASEFTTMENASAHARRVILPDGSIVEMSPSTTIRYPNNNQAASRELFLEGEAYFDVAHNKDRPFYVYAGNIITKVLGTSFFVRAVDKDEKVTVSVKTGKVTVYSKNAVHKKTVLVPHQEAVYDRSTNVVATRPVSEKKLNDEKRNFAEMHFDETPVPAVLAALTKTYNINIVFDPEKLSACVLTSSFLEEGLYDRIDVICTAIGATYKVVDARIVIESNGCSIKTN